MFKRLFSIKRQLPEIDESNLKDEDFSVFLNTDAPVIFELGANDGGATKMFLEKMVKSRVFAFEPDPRAAGRFRDRIGDDDRVVLCESAIGNDDGKVTFYQSGGAPNENIAKRMPDGWDLSGSIRKPKDHIEMVPWCTFDETVEVAITKLDTWTTKHFPEGVIDFIWADLQGAEMDMILGANETLKRTRFLYAEYNRAELYEGQSSLEALLDAVPDFEIERLYDTDVLLKNRKIG